MRGLKGKIILMNVIISIIVAISLAGVCIVNLNNNNKVTIQEYEKMLRSDYDENIKYQVQNVMTLLNGIYEKQLDGEFTEEQAKEQAKYLVKSLRYNGDGYFWIDDVNAMLVAHPILPQSEGENRIDETDKNGIKLIQNIINISKEEGGGYTDFYYIKPNEDGVSPKRAYSELFDPYGWIVSTGNYVDDIDKEVEEKGVVLNSNLRNTTIAILGLTMILIIAAILVAVKVSSDLAKPLKKIYELAERLSNYDFSKSIDIKDKSEFGMTAEALNKAQDNIRNLIKNIRDNALKLTESSEELSALTNDVTQKAHDMAEETKIIVENMNESDESIKQINESMNEINSSVEQLATKSTDSSSISIDFKDKSLKLKNRGNISLNQTQNIYAEKEEKIIEAIKDGKVVEQISTMVDAISAIAEQTNLLALNASIEASRAGEHGKGFAVVAEEVRKLSEESTTSANSIQDTVKRVQKAFKKLSDNSDEILAFINSDVVNQFNDFISSGEYYYDNAEEISTISQDIAAMSEQLNASMEEIKAMISTMASNSEIANENSMKIFEGIKETTASINEVAVTAESQADLAMKLNGLIDGFKID